MQIALNNMSNDNRIGVCSRKLANNPVIATLLDAKLEHVCVFRPYAARRMDAIAGWGYRPAGQRSHRLAQNYKKPFFFLEDGFIRSLGRHTPLLSLAVDTVAPYYDSHHVTDMERVINKTILSETQHQQACNFIDKIIEHGISKINMSSNWHVPSALSKGHMILLIDQVAGDLSLKYGGVTEQHWQQLYDTARRLYPDLPIYVKTHPDVFHGKVKGCLDFLRNKDDISWITQPCRLASVLPYAHAVFAATSLGGFEACLHQKPVHLFGLPWYAGWGITSDHHPYAQTLLGNRRQPKTLETIFYAVYCNYMRYINPLANDLQTGKFEDVLTYLSYHLPHLNQMQGDLICFGFGRWKQKDMLAYIKTDDNNIKFLTPKQAMQLPATNTNNRKIIVWGKRHIQQAEQIANTWQCPLITVEDGFLRSAGHLGSDFTMAFSLVFDDQGIYYDSQSNQPSKLDKILQQRPFSQSLLERAKYIQHIMTAHFISKYTLSNRHQKLSCTLPSDRRIILVPGQVADDASLRYGCDQIHDNPDLYLLQQVRHNNPDAFIIYRPHPDIMACNRRKSTNLTACKALIDYLDTNSGIGPCLQSSDEIHTMTSLTGFEGLLHNKIVVTYGMPFYAGYGLTQDKLPPPSWRQGMKLSLQELIAAAFILYPHYRHPQTQLPCNVENILHYLQNYIPSYTQRHNNSVLFYVSKRLFQVRKWLFMK